MSNIQSQRLEVEQLRREATIKRITVSQAVEDIRHILDQPDADQIRVEESQDQKADQGTCTLYGNKIDA